MKKILIYASLINIAGNRGMMIRPVYATNLKEVIEAVLNFSRKGEPKDKILWYRGQYNSEHSLVTSLYRKLKDSNSFESDAREAEEYLKKEFVKKNYDLLPRLPENKWLALALMQHHRTPTRLLDWTENLFAGLFFALYDESVSEETKIGKVPCLWCLMPQLLLQLPYIAKDDLTEENRKVVPNCDTDDITDLIENKITYPLPIYSAYNSTRIRAQSGTFTVFPIREGKENNLVGLEKMKGAENFLRKINLVRPFKLRKELTSIGIHQSMFFPEMQSIGAEISQGYFDSK